MQTFPTTTVGFMRLVLPIDMIIPLLNSSSNNNHLNVAAAAGVVSKSSQERDRHFSPEGERKTKQKILAYWKLIRPRNFW